MLSEISEAFQNRPSVASQRRKEMKTCRMEGVHTHCATSKAFKRYSEKKFLNNDNLNSTPTTSFQENRTC